MEMNIIDKSGLFDGYVNKTYSKDVKKYVDQKKTLIYLPKDLNALVSGKLIDLIGENSKVSKSELGVINGNYVAKVEYK